SGAAFVAKLNRRLGRLFPQIDALDWEYRWNGWVAMTLDRYPHLHALAPGLWTGLGYSGRGIGLATVMGREVAGRIAGVADADLPLPVTPLEPSWVTRAARPLVNSLLTYHRLQDAVAGVRRRATASA